jgi:hypothetical protein
MLDMTDPAWNDLFHVVPSTATDKDVGLSFGRRADYKTENVQFYYGGPVVLICLPAVDPTRPFWYECRGPQKLLYAKNLLTDAAYPLSIVPIKAYARISLCCTAPDVVYAAYREAGVPTIRRIVRDGTTSTVFPDQTNLIIGDIVFAKNDDNDDDDVTFYVQTDRGPHRADLSPKRLVPLLNGSVPIFDNDGGGVNPKPRWSPYLLMLANGMLLAQMYVGDQSAVVVIDPARFGWIQRIATMDMSFHSIAVSRSDSNLLFVAANERPNRPEQVQSTVEDAVGCLPVRLSRLVAEYQDETRTFVPKRHLHALRLPSDFWNGGIDRKACATIDSDLASVTAAGKRKLESGDESGSAAAASNASGIDKKSENGASRTILHNRLQTKTCFRKINKFTKQKIRY